MYKTHLLLFSIMSLFVLVLAACGTAAEPEAAAPTARPYTAMELPPPYENSEQIVGNKENGQVLYQQYCSQCHATEQNGVSVAPSLFGAGSRLSYDKAKEAIVYPKAHNDYLKDELHAVDVDMPADFGGLFTLQQLEDLVTFIRSL